MAERRHYSIHNNSSQMAQILRPGASYSSITKMTDDYLNQQRQNLPRLDNNPMSYGNPTKLITFYGVTHTHQYDTQPETIKRIIQTLPSTSCIILEGDQPPDDVLNNSEKAIEYGENAYAAYCVKQRNLEFKFPEDGIRNDFLSKVPAINKVSNSCLHGLRHFYRSDHKSLQEFMERAVKNANETFQIDPKITHLAVKKQICEALLLDEKTAYEQISLEKPDSNQPILKKIISQLNPNDDNPKSVITQFEKDLSNHRERLLMKEIESTYKQNRPCFIVYGYGHLQVNHRMLETSFV